MRLRLFDRLRQFARWCVGTRALGHGREHSRRDGTVPSRASAVPPSAVPPSAVPPSAVPASWAATPPGGGPLHPGGGAGNHPWPTRPAANGGGAGRARIRQAPFGTAPVSQEVPRQAQAAPRQPRYRSAATRRPPGQIRPIDAAGLAGLVDVAGLADAPGRTGTASLAASRARLANTMAPFAAPHPQGHPPTADGRRNCGPLEAILWRQWDEVVTPPPEVVAAIDRLAEFPRQLKERLAAGLDSIYVGPGGVPELDDMTALRGVPLPSGRATWDVCAGAYGERKIVVGSRPSPTPDVMCHEVGHALDDLDSPPGKWQSDSAEFRLLYDQCQPYIASDFHRQRGGLGRKEFFADAFAGIASGQRPALVDMLSGNTRIALQVMLYFNRRYGI
jgi:hypothetical protein